MTDLRSRLVASPCCLPQLELDELLLLYSDIGFSKFELFTAWGGPSSIPDDAAFRFPSLVHPEANPAELRERMERHGLRAASVHLPPLTDEFETTLAQAITAARFAAGVGARVVIFKATERSLYARGARRFLEATADLSLQPVIQNHVGAPISTISDLHEVLGEIDDERMATLLDVGHLVRTGSSWSDALEQLDGSLALVHVNDIDAQGRSVAFGSGTVDFGALLRQLDSMGYLSDVVVELEMDGHTKSVEPTATELGNAFQLLCKAAEAGTDACRHREGAAHR